MCMQSIKRLTYECVFICLSPPTHTPQLRLLEVDERFGVKYPDLFHRFDYNEPTGKGEWGSRGWIQVMCAGMHKF
jgi:hypothetical protein